MTEANPTPEGEEPQPEAAAPPPEPPEPTEPTESTGSTGEPHTFGDAAAEMANEPFDTPRSSATQEPTEVEGGEPGETSASDELVTTQMALAERTADLQRLQAEFLNYKRRVDRDRDLLRENATYAVLAPITEVLDTIDRAREHGAQGDDFKAVSEQLERIVTSLGLTKFGAVGDAFDPSLHEALSHVGEDPDVEVTTCKVIAKAGYRIGDRVVRAAQVLVVDPASGPTA